MYLNKIIQVMKNDFPLIKNMELYGFTEQLSSDEYNYVLSGIFGEPVEKSGNLIFNQNEIRIYSEDYNGSWTKYEYDNNGNKIYEEHSDGYWRRFEYDNNGKLTYLEDSYGYWSKREYNENGNRIYYEDSSGYIEDYRWKYEKNN